MVASPDGVLGEIVNLLQRFFGPSWPPAIGWKIFGTCVLLRASRTIYIVRRPGRHFARNTQLPGVQRVLERRPAAACFGPKRAFEPKSP